MDGSKDVNDAVVDGWTAETTAFERVHAVAGRLHDPASAQTVADRARVSETTARTHLRTLAETGTVVTVEGSPTMYRRSRASVVTERAAAILSNHSTEELTTRITELRDRLSELRATHGVESPEALAQRRDTVDPDTSLGKQVREWRTTRRNLRLAEAALAVAEVPHSGDSTDSDDTAEFGASITS